SFAGGASLSVTWTSSGGFGNVDIELSTDGGATWTTLVQSTANDGSQAMSLPEVATPRATIRVRESGGSAQDSSDAFFSIESGSGGGGGGAGGGGSPGGGAGSGRHHHQRCLASIDAPLSLGRLGMAMLLALAYALGFLPRSPFSKGTLRSRRRRI